MENISEHITYKEAVESPTAEANNIDNTPDNESLVRMKLVAQVCFEPLRSWYGKPLKVNSFYRCPTLNSIIGGSKTSQHMKGEAIDVSGESRSENKKILEWCKANLKYDQLINEFPNEDGPKWVHISFSKNGNRNQFITVAK